MKRHLRLASASLSVALGGDIRHEVTVVSSPSDDYLSICGCEFDVDGGGYSTCVIDLDGDGLLDQMFANAATSGTGGQAATVYPARKDGGFARIGTLGHGGIAAETTKTGGRLLHCPWSLGGGETPITTYLISHDGLKELMVIGGKWDDPAYQKRFKVISPLPANIYLHFVQDLWIRKVTVKERRGRVLFRCQNPLDNAPHSMHESVNHEPTSPCRRSACASL